MSRIALGCAAPTQVCVERTASGQRQPLLPNYKDVRLSCDAAGAAPLARNDNRARGGPHPAWMLSGTSQVLMSSFSAAVVPLDAA